MGVSGGLFRFIEVGGWWLCPLSLSLSHRGRGNACTSAGCQACTPRIKCGILRLSRGSVCRFEQSVDTALVLN